MVHAGCAHQGKLRAEFGGRRRGRGVAGRGQQLQPYMVDVDTALPGDESLGCWSRELEVDDGAALFPSKVDLGAF